MTNYRNSPLLDYKDLNPSDCSADLFTDGSDIGWGPGYWPDAIAVSSGRIATTYERDDDPAHRLPCGGFRYVNTRVPCLGVQIFND